MLCQTEELRSLIEASVPGSGGRCELWSPIVPAPEVDVPARTGISDPLRLGLLALASWLLLALRW